MQKTDSNLQLKSNIITKSKIIEHTDWLTYAPADLLMQLFPEYRDSRADRFLTYKQRKQKREHYS